MQLALKSPGPRATLLIRPMVGIWRSYHQEYNCVDKLTIITGPEGVRSGDVLPRTLVVIKDNSVRPSALFDYPFG